MTFEEILDQAIAMLQRRGRVAYRALRRQFDLDDDHLQDLRDAILFEHPGVDEADRGLVWPGAMASASTHEQVSPSVLVRQQKEPLLAYTPRHLTDKIFTSRAALEGERKQITVLFADIKGSTELIEDLDPEDAQRLLDPVLHHMMDAVHQYEGTVNQVLGDGIMALFGAPLAHEDHAVRACYAALAMQTAMQPYTDEVRRTHGLAMQIRVGLNSGEVVVRTISSDLHMDYSAVGQTTHLAARMEQAATPGSILMTAETLRLVEGLVRAERLGPIAVKGASEPVEVFELTGASASRRRFQAVAVRGLTRFVGRDAELETLTQAFERAGAGQGQVVAAFGEAGVGKSRLVYECIHAHEREGWRVLESASVSYGKATPYFPVIDLLKRYVHVEDSDDPRTIRAKVTGHILTLDDTLQDTIPALLSLLEALPEDSPFLQLDPPGRRQRTLDGLTQILLRESQVQRLLLVFEDLHWIDSETQALLDCLAQRLPTARLLLLVNYRPEYQHGWGNKTYYTQIRLDPLQPASAEALLQTLLGDDPSLIPLKKRLIKQTAGNPFFLEESVRTLVETQVLVGEHGAYCLVQELPTIQVPATVQAILAARIDRLPPDEKQLLQTAAVIGAEVPLPLLQAIAEVPEASLHRDLTHLQAAEFLYESSLFPEHTYTFKHALTHEVSYGSLLQERRRVLHARIVEALERLSDESAADQIERLAHHALRGEVWDKAVTYCRQAGNKGMEQSAYQEAVVRFEQALEALSHLPKDRDMQEQAIDMRLALRSPLHALGASERILDNLREAESIAEVLDDPQRLGRVLSYMASYFSQTGKHAQAIEALHRALNLATTHGDFALQIDANFRLGGAHSALGNYRQAIEVLTKNVTALTGDLRHESFGRVAYPAVTSRAIMAVCHAELGEFSAGITRKDEAVQIAETVDHPMNLTYVHGLATALYLIKGDMHKAIPWLEHALSLCQSRHIVLLYSTIAVNLGYAYALAQRGAEALPLLEVDGIVRSPERLIETYLLLGRIEDACAHATRLLEESRLENLQGTQAHILRLLGAIAMHRNPAEIDQAETYYQQALTLANERVMRPLQAHCHHGLGTLYSQTGQREQARAELSTAVEMYRDMEMTFWLTPAEATLAQI